MLSVLGGRLVLHVKLVDGAVVNISPIGIADFSEGCRLDAAHGVLKDLVGRWVALERIGEGTTEVQLLLIARALGLTSLGSGARPAR